MKLSAGLLVVTLGVLLWSIILAVREWRKPAGRPGALVPTILIGLSLMPGGLVQALGIPADDKISIVAQIATVVLLVCAVVALVVYLFRVRSA
jgi:hypothetical protein